VTVCVDRLGASIEQPVLITRCVFHTLLQLSAEPPERGAPQKDGCFSQVFCSTTEVFGEGSLAVAMLGGET